MAAARSIEPGYLDGISPTTSAEGFVHPGVFLGLPELESVRRKIVAGDEPQTSIFTWLRGPANRPLVEREPTWDGYSDALDLSLPCDPSSNRGCMMDVGYGGSKERELTNLGKQSMGAQINSAYTNALLYYYSGGEDEYAQNAIRTLNAYSRVFKGFISTEANAHVGDLFAAWVSQILVRAAEIIRYTYTPSPGQESFDVEAFEVMLRTAFVPRLQDGTVHINNWRTSAADGLMNIGIFLDDRDLYDRALEIWREVTRAYIYLSSDGERPASLLRGSKAQQDCSWIHNFSTACKTEPKTDPGLIYQNGQNQEICRDMWHSSAGVGGIINVAETARIQGDDLYAEEEARIKTALSYMLQLSQEVKNQGYPDNFCAEASEFDGTGSSGLRFPIAWDDFEPLSAVVAFNHYVGREGSSFARVEIPGYHSDSDADPVAAFIDEHLSGPQDSRAYVTTWQVLSHHGVGVGVQAEAGSSTRPATTSPVTPAPSSGARNGGPTGWLVPGGLVLVCISLGAFLLVNRQRRRHHLD